MAVNITTNNNTVKVVTTPANKVKVVNNITNTSVTVTQPTPTQVVRVVTAGPQGPQGPQGEGANINTGSFATTGSNTFTGDQTITGSLTVSGSNTFTNIGPAVFSGSINVTQGITGSLFGTASFASTASFVSLPTFTSGSVLFSNGTTIAQDNANLFWDDTNNRLGIGTNAPTTALDVNGTVKALALQTTDLISNSPTQIILVKNSSGTISARLFSDGSIFRISSSGQTATINIFANGNLGVNQTTDAGFRLDVNGTARVSGQTTLKGAGATTATTALRVENTNASASLVVNDAGNVLVGTATDGGFKLDVNGTARVQGNLTLTTGIVAGTGNTILQNSTNYFTHNRIASSGAFGFQISNYSTLASFWRYDTGTGDTEFGQSLNSGLNLFTNNLNRLRIVNNGNVLINTTTDTGHKLLVTGSGTSGSLNVDGTLYVSGSRVGIGTSTPTTALHLVTNNSLINTTLKFQTFSTTANILTFNNSNDTEQGLLVGTGNAFNFGTYQQNQIILVGGAGGVSIRTSNGANAHIRFNSGNANYGLSAEIARFVASSGNLLLNTTTDAGFKLDVNGTARFANSVTIEQNARLSYGIISNENYNIWDGSRIFRNRGVQEWSNLTQSHLNFRWFFNNSSTDILRLQATNQVGIGTSANVDLSAILAVESTTRGFLPPRMTTAQRDAIATPATGLMVYDSSSLTPSIYNGVNWQNVLIPNSSGSVGIGTTTPSASLHISGASSANLLRIDSPASSSILFVSGSGNVGIGTSTPAYKLTVAGTIDAGTNLIGNGGWNQGIQPQGGTGEFRFVNSTGNGFFFTWVQNNGLERMRLSSNNNLLVGTTTDAGFRLDVNGTARFVNTISYNGNLTPLNTAAYSLGMSSTASIAKITAYTNNGLSAMQSLEFGFNNTNLNSDGNFSNPAHNNYAFRIYGNYTPSGTGGGALSSFLISPTLNFTGNANAGTYRGFYYNPTLTNLTNTTHRAIETVTGDVIFGSTSGNVGIGTSTPANKVDILGDIRISNQTLVGNNGGQIVLKATDGNPAVIGIQGNYWQALGFWGMNRFTTSATPDLRVLGTGDVNVTTNLLINTTTNLAKLAVRGSGATSATTTFLLQNSTPTNLLSILDNGQVAFTSPTMSLAASQSAFSISPIISASAVVGGQYYGVNITPTFFQTTGSQTETAFRVAATYTGSSAAATGGTNIIADFGSTSAGSQLTVTDVTSGSIYMVNDVSGLPIIEATSDWGVKIYDFPRVVLEKTGSQVNINGTLQVSGSFILPLSQSATPQTGSAYWSGSLLFIYNGTRYMSASFF